jgi:hypothetical protein
MKNLLLIILYTYFLAIAGGITDAQSLSRANATGRIFAEVISVYSATETSQMNFGRFSPGPQGGEIILTPGNTISVQGSIYKGIGSHNAASFYLTGDVDAAYSISLPIDPVVLIHSSDSKTMVIERWISIPSPGVGIGMLREGAQVVYVGATLKVGTLYDNPVGIYTGSYTITFDFN